MNNKEIIVECPHCKDLISILENEINCGIFRHAVYKENMKYINPHATYDECQELIKNNSIYGCCKPFKLIKIDYYYYTVKCDYI